ncbi:hypothetical protein BE18_38580 [Sorangium cellulosum]|uniref:PEGA domain-containing protein n=1 Tax=Sorangium cellulosum TaxID=56 RepID=A0A150SYE4_SORCE|nr:hypothetical protein BE18_38580 [Sorangium cellulosum]
MTTRHRSVRVAPAAVRALLIAIVASCAAPARAQAPSPEAAESPPPPPAPSRLAPAPPEAAEPSSPPPPPWHHGVSEERKQKAQALFEEARELHRRMVLAEARAKYEEALASWEHPELRLYLGRALTSIGLPLLAYDNLRMSLRWGPGSLDPEAEQEARAAMRALVEQELAVIEIRCDEPGAAVLLDGKPWFVGPGAQRRIVTPGEHILTARKGGHFTVVKPIVVLAGKEASGALALRADTVVTRQRWPAWLPWATLGAGAALGIAGGGLMWHADTYHDEAHQRFQGSCHPSCAPSARDEYDGSVLESRLAFGALAAGGATAIAGTVLLFMNRPETFRTEDRGGVMVELRPAASLDAAMLSGRLVF